MKKFLLMLFVLAMPLVASAQVKFGYFSFSEILNTMPDRAIADRNLADLRLKYDAEMKRAENEFNAKYEEFLEGQRDFVPSILRKRQAELQEMMEKNVAFRKEAERLLKQAQDDAYAPLRKKINEAAAKVGRARSYAFILNTDGDACPYVDASMGEDATIFIRELLGMNK
jgi:outer membrane protein